MVVFKNLYGRKYYMVERINYEFLLSHFCWLIFSLLLSFFDFWYMFSAGVISLFLNYEIRLARVVQCLLRQTLAKKNLTEPIKLINYFFYHTLFQILKYIYANIFCNKNEVLRKGFFCLWVRVVTQVKSEEIPLTPRNARSLPISDR